MGERVNSAGVVRKDGTGANRMTGLVTRDSAQLQPIASIGQMRVLTYSTSQMLAFVAPSASDSLATVRPCKLVPT